MRRRRRRRGATGAARRARRGAPRGRRAGRRNRTGGRRRERRGEEEEEEKKQEQEQEREGQEEHEGEEEGGGRRIGGGECLDGDNGLTWGVRATPEAPSAPDRLQTPSRPAQDSPRMYLGRPGQVPIRAKTAQGSRSLPDAPRGPPRKELVFECFVYISIYVCIYTVRPLK